MQKQVERSHYEFTKYMSKGRWSSTWHQFDELMKFKPETVLEIGPGLGVLKQMGRVWGLNVRTLDIDPELEPDILGSATQIPLGDGAVEVTCAFQVLEHMPWETSRKALAEMFRVSSRAVIISLPDVTPCWANTLALPYMRIRKFILKNPFSRPNPHLFDGEHYWEIGKTGYLFEKIRKNLCSIAPQGTALRSFRVHEFTYHRFFIFKLPAK